MSNPIQPPQALSQNAHIKTAAQLEQWRKQALKDPETFWAEQAKQNITWSKPWETVLQYDWSTIGTKAEPFVEWFKGGELNASYNCLDRHVLAGQGEKTAIIWQGEAEAEQRRYTYTELLTAVSRFANVLKKLGATKGSVVTIFLPFIPELPIAMLACARIGAIHSVVFSAFSAEALKNRIEDCKSQIVITADAGFYKGKAIPLKNKTDEAVAQCPTVQHVIMLQHGKEAVTLQPQRDVLWQEAVNAADITDTCVPVAMNAEDPLFIRYTSGSTGKPKGVLHTTGGYLVYANLTSRLVFDL